MNDTHTYLGKDTEENKTFTGAITFMGERIQNGEKKFTGWNSLCREFYAEQITYAEACRLERKQLVGRIKINWLRTDII